jgi:hypothetical protein
MKLPADTADHRVAELQKHLLHAGGDYSAHIFTTWRWPFGASRITSSREATHPAPHQMRDSALDSALHFDAATTRFGRALSPHRDAREKAQKHEA